MKEFPLTIPDKYDGLPFDELWPNALILSHGIFIFDSRFSNWTGNNNIINFLMFQMKKKCIITKK